MGVVSPRGSQLCDWCRRVLVKPHTRTHNTRIFFEIRTRRRSNLDGVRLSVAATYQGALRYLSESATVGPGVVVREALEALLATRGYIGCTSCC